ncbi:ribosomal RNA small subunit methyltransferase nep-1 isoform X1 [Abrus precatorius]|uniref:Ribosomal RNA small subunit methyltransferase nep-1 isoform X1 n=1 Tax=Abrus precatorius TaxID=3816 RepID=A0A8B8LCJ7_ABRPR|nr:ribosomal RNA small subunit methyltransferase nep-1 isoform X1 [Abrus precatorius]XP_027353952.1 ribosomal RNA small subunit methyltransferase nep-1 isoform X1 [Abrus precatorius]
MTRHYSVKGRKRKHAETKYDREDEEEPKQLAVSHEERTPTPTPAEEDELSGIPIAPSENNSDKPSVIFILERATLEVAKVGKTYQLLNSDDHANFLRKNNKNPADYRPDITHQILLSILDSPLNKAGRLRVVYIKTEKGVLIEVKPFVRIPRTFKRFAGVMLELLQKLSISAVGKREKLLRTIKNPVTQYLPVNSRKIGLSYSSEKLVDMCDYVSTIPSNMDLAFVVGAIAHGKIETDYTDDYIAISGYPLSAAYCITRITGALERKWKIL